MLLLNHTNVLHRLPEALWEEVKGSISLSDRIQLQRNMEAVELVYVFYRIQLSCKSIPNKWWESARTGLRSWFSFVQVAVMLGKWIHFSLALFPYKYSGEGVPGSSAVKNLPANAEDLGSVPGLGRSPSERNGNPLQYFCLKNPMGRGAWQALAHRVAKTWTWLSTHTQWGC